MNSEWDENINNTELFKKCNAWLEELDKCKDVVVSRSIMPEVFSEVLRCELIGFSDGSANAHGCTLYVRWFDEDETNIEVKFIGAKAKVNPIKGTTIPR